MTLRMIFSIPRLGTYTRPAMATPGSVESGCIKSLQICIVRLALVPRDVDDTSVLTALDVPILELDISDNGRGIPPRTQTHGAGLGLSSMQERAAELGERCVIEPAAGGGTRVYARLPCPHFL